MALLHKKQANHCSTGCMVMKWVVGLLLFITTVAALVGVYETHVITSSEPTRIMMQYGSTAGSLAIIAFTLSVMAFLKQMVCCMSQNCEVCNPK